MNWLRQINNILCYVCIMKPYPMEGKTEGLQIYIVYDEKIFFLSFITTIYLLSILNQ